MRRAALFLILIITISINSNAQKLAKSDFKATSWFANNENQSFYSSDSLSLIRILNFNTENDRLNELNIKLQQNKHRDITELTFEKSGRLNVQDLLVKSWTNSKLNGKWSWSFNSDDQILSLYFRRKLHSSFKITSKENDSIVWNFEYNQRKTESKLNLLILNLVRIK